MLSKGQHPFMKIIFQKYAFFFLHIFWSCFLYLFAFASVLILKWIKLTSHEWYHCAAINTRQTLGLWPYLPCSKKRAGPTPKTDVRYTCEAPCRLAWFFPISSFLSNLNITLLVTSLQTAAILVLLIVETNRLEKACLLVFLRWSEN